MIVIEVAGAPGAGKTSLLPTVSVACVAAGLRPYTVETAARPFVERTPPGWLLRLLPASPRRRAAWGLYRVLSWMAAVRLALTRPALARHVLMSQRRRPAEADAGARRVLYWYIRTAGSYELLRSLGRPGEALILDEGFVHRTVQVHTSAVEKPDLDRIAAYVALLPPCDVVVVVRASVDACIRRVHARGAWSRLRHREAAEIDSFVRNAHQAIELAAEAARRTGRPVLDVDNDGDVAGAESALHERLAEQLRRDVPRARKQPQARPRLRLPRRAELVRTFKARTSVPAIDAGGCDGILSEYGLEATGPPVNVPFGARNANVIVHTNGGTKVVRRHRSTSQLRSILHEHAILLELERLDFPAVRVRKARDGHTVVHRGEDTYAVFEFEPGRNLSSSYLPRSGRAGLVDAAGRTLASLHGALADFHPPGGHHVGHRTPDGGVAADLAWHLQALDDIASQASGRQAEDKDHAGLLGRRVWLTAELIRLHDRLAEASPREVLIHGDYGLHNLMFRRDGVAVVSDFELARRDWRLVDLIIVMSRMRSELTPTFLDGYRSEADLPSTEWKHLDDVWQYHRLTGAIRSWHNYCRYGGEHRLVTAVERLEQAAAVRSRAMAIWA